MTYFRVSRAAALLGVSDDTVRRYISLGRLPVPRDEANRRVIDGVALAARVTAFARETMTPAPDPSPVASSARNRLVGVVTDVHVDKVMAQVEMQCGSHRVASLISREAVGDMGLKPGVVAVAMIKSTNVVVEVPDIAVHARRRERGLVDRLSGRPGRGLLLRSQVPGSGAVTLAAAFAAGVLVTVITAPVGRSGAVFLLPAQSDRLRVPSPAVTPTNLLFNVAATPGASWRYRRAGSST